MLHMLSLNQHILWHKIPGNLTKMCKGNLCIQLLECWFVLKNIRPIGDNESLNEYFL